MLTMNAFVMSGRSLGVVVEFLFISVSHFIWPSLQLICISGDINGSGVISGLLAPSRNGSPDRPSIDHCPLMLTLLIPVTNFFLFGCTVLGGSAVAVAWRTLVKVQLFLVFKRTDRETDSLCRSKNIITVTFVPRRNTLSL